jgi:hypothetical protein
MGLNDVETSLDLNTDTPRVLELVAQFHQFARKSAEGVLEMARVVRAASLLHVSEFHRFGEHTGVRVGSSTARKLIVIGEKYDFLIDQADKLPSNWTTVYAVARLGREQIQWLIDQGMVNTNTAATDLERALKARTHNQLAQTLSLAAAAVTTTTPASAVRATGSKYKRPSFKVELNANPDAGTLAAMKLLIEQLSTMQTKVTLNNTMASALQD